LEYLWVDISDAFINFLGIFTYASLLIVINPIIFAVVAVVSVLSYFTTRWQPAYFEKNKQHWEKESRKRNYLQSLSENFSMAKDIKLYNLEGWLDKMMRWNDVFVCRCAKFRQKDVILRVECASNAQEWKNKQNINTQNEKFYQVHNGNRGGYIPDHDVVYNHRHHFPGRNACH
jgi:hypothetical protein